jgi:hypothetical protein
MNSTIKTTAEVTEELNQSSRNSDIKKVSIQHTKAKLGESLKKIWEIKEIYGQYVRSTDRQLISEEDTLLWLSRGDLEAETENEIILSQGLALQTKCNAREILKTGIDSKCRLYQQIDETVEHIIL